MDTATKLVDVGLRLQKLWEENQAQLTIKKRVEQELAQATAQCATTEQSLLTIEKAAILISSVESAQQQELKNKVESLISYGLQTVFERPYKFLVQQDLRGNQTDTTFCVLSPEYGDKAIPLKDAHGGGLVVFCAFLLRFIILMSIKPAVRPCLFLDEQMMAISADYRSRLTGFVKQLAEKADLQLIIITHDQDLVEIGDKNYRFKLVGGLTQVEVI